MAAARLTGRGSRWSGPVLLPGMRHGVGGPSPGAVLSTGWAERPSQRG
jgi:hypothetical protein